MRDAWREQYLDGGWEAIDCTEELRWIMVFGNYRELVRPADAKKWFAIEPEPAAKVAPLPGIGAA